MAETAQIAATGGAQTYKTVELPIPATAGTHELFLVFRNPGASGSLINVNQFEFVGQGAAVTAPPAVTVNAIPVSGNAPMSVVFDTTATDPDGSGPLTYAWSFGDGSPDSTQQDPTHLYSAPGTFVATLTVTDADGGVTAVQTPISVGAVIGTCPPGFRDDFNGVDLAPSWTVLRRDQTLTVGNGLVSIPTQAGDLYQTANTAKNIVLRPAPTGNFTIAAKINHKGLVQYQQAGIIVYGTDDNYVKLDRTASNTADRGQHRVLRVHPGGQRHRAQRSAGPHREPRGHVPAGLLPADRLERHQPDRRRTRPTGRRGRSVGRASTAMPANAQVGFFALSNAAATTVTPTFDWFTIEGPNVPPDPNCTPGTGANTDPVITSATASQSFGIAPLPVDFTAAATDADGDPLTYLWDFDNDGSIDATGATAAHTYTAGGSPTAKLTVTDGKGGVATRTISIDGDRARRPVGQAARARVLQDRGLPPRLHHRGHQRAQGARDREELPGRRDRGRGVVPRRHPQPLRHGDLPVDHR